MAEHATAAAAAAAGEEYKKLKVMVAVDDSEGSLYALAWALDRLLGPPSLPAASAEKLGSLFLVHAMQPFQHYIFPSGPGIVATSPVLDSVKKAQQENSARLLERAMAVCRERMVKAEALVFEGDPKDAICEAVEQMQVDLLVVGSRGLGTIKRAFLGSVSDYVAHHAKCPVLIVKPPKKKDQ